MPTIWVHRLPALVHSLSIQVHNLSILAHCMFTTQQVEMRIKRIAVGLTTALTAQFHMFLRERKVCGTVPSFFN